MSLRAFLQSQGLSEKDIDEAVEEARSVAEMVHSGSALIAKFLMGAVDRVKNEKTKHALVMGAGAALKIHEGTSELLKKR